ncbi:hypothetical protein GCM10010987_13070 [Bradyrhizobium guangdongense]|uniref:OpgC domain-containing protein n=1 Tax=Bradyrhizobium guangdongense TaxID=1325090 RepID=A0A410VBL8_9BRAD|nr:OpgC domain-containing protein [Bradyrhizobium guangdongense]QOZ62078.1 OpgC domain-containing protein [Bradyrhizobium guangdongense]GGI21188.1 hypothetical protein GCM10010987_13070 [Bradyrhizobium guangdongense]
MLVRGARLNAGTNDLNHDPKHGCDHVGYLDGDRDLRLDACRGLALWFIFIDHIPGNAFDWLTLRNYGFSDTSEIFVFVSGYTCMLSYGGALRRQGWPTVVVRSLRRSLEIYAAFLLLVIAYLALVWVTGTDLYRDETNTRVFFDNPGIALIHLLALQYTPVNTDILPLFVMLHFGFPLVLWFMIRNATIALSASFLLYMMVQLYSWNLPAWPAREAYFNPLAWQMLFVLGAYCATPGAARLAGISLSPVVVSVAASVVIFSLVVTLSWRIEQLKWLVPDAVVGWIYPIYKTHLAPPRLVHFLALMVLGMRFLSPIKHSKLKPWAVAMIRCGENSLSIYCFSVLASFLGFVVLNEISGRLAMEAIVSASGIILMIAIASLLAWEAKFDRRGPKPF